MLKIAAGVAVAALMAGAVHAQTVPPTDLPPPPEMLGLKWREPPSLQMLGRVYPSRARHAKVQRGLAQTACTPKADGRLDCVLLREDPAGYGFGEAAVAVMSRARVAAADGGSPEGRRFGFTVRFGNWPASAVMSTAMAQHGLAWVAPPILSSAAQRKESDTHLASAKVACEVLAGGALDCQVVSASEAWYGEALEEAVERTRVRALDGRPLEGRRFTFSDQRTTSIGQPRSR